MQPLRSEEVDFTSCGLKPVLFQQVLPTSGLVMAETQSTTPVLCKPKILPIKSAAFIKQREQQLQNEEAAS